jgi:polyferredoxin/NAD-dependent dihydropyrimidine dehydrogenase PreA subunit
MRISTARRIAQIFFLAVFVWLALVATVGTAWTQWRGWPISWFLELDPLAAVGTALATHSLSPGFGWALATVAVTIVFGRVFCGFVCPFGALHQFVGWLGRLGRRPKDKISANSYRPAQAAKYYVLVAVLAAAALSAGGGSAGSLQTGLLDPISMLQRSINLIVLPAADLAFERMFHGGRFAVGAWLLGGLFAASLLINLWIPRFYCRFVCPLGALLGVLSRPSLWGIGKAGGECDECGLCDIDCEGACNPMGPIRVSECLMCMNCLDSCPKLAPVAYLPRPSAGGELTSHGVTRRGFVVAAVSGLSAAALARLGGQTARAWSPSLIRPPGSVAEPEFLARCVKCCECVRVCPTNALQPALVEHGLEALWTPVLNNRIGTSGCQLNCVACGYACPTGAIRPITLEEKQGREDFERVGPVRIGLASVDRGRCLPWAMDRPCIVCQENCPVTPKAIYVTEAEQTVRDGALEVLSVSGHTLKIRGPRLEAGRFATGDYTCALAGDERGRAVVANTEDTLTVEESSKQPLIAEPGTLAELRVRLQRPVVDPSLCIGCGVCEHECPMSGQRAIRVAADNETRDPRHAVVIAPHSA